MKFHGAKFHCLGSIPVLAHTSANIAVWHTACLSSVVEDSAIGFWLE